MKKIILFIALATLSMSLNSCSSDDTGFRSFIKVDYNGISTTYNNVRVFVDNTNIQEVKLVITAIKGSNSSETFSFTTVQKSTGSNKYRK